MALNTKRKSVKLNGYDYSDHYRREETAAALLEEASLSKDRISAYWKRMRRYYDGVHDINSSTSSFYRGKQNPVARCTVHRRIYSRRNADRAGYSGF